MNYLWIETKIAANIGLPKDW